MVVASVPSLPFDDRGLAYGDGLFETVLVRDGNAVLWEQHLNRLMLGCEVLDIPAPSRDQLDAILSRLGGGLQVLKLIYTRGSGGRGYAPPAEAAPRLYWQATPFSPQQMRWKQGVRIRLCHMSLARQPRLAGIKHMARLENVLARSEWRDPDIAEGLVTDGHARVVEATAMNLFWSSSSQSMPCTPSLEHCGVLGTLRQVMLDAGELMIGELGVEELSGCEALWVGNSVQGLWPVARLDDAEGRILGEWPITATHRHLQRLAHDHLGYPAI